MGWGGALDVLSSVVQKYTTLDKSRLLTANLTSVELATLEGLRFNSTADFTLAASGGADTAYIIYQMPPAASGRVIGLQNRIFKSLNGEAEIEILWDSTGVVLGAAVPVFNENRNSAVVGLMDVNFVTSLTTEGAIRESDFLTGAGQGSNSSGDISSGTGLRIYSPDSFFIAKVTNLHNQANRVILAYAVVELDAEGQV